MSLYDAFQFVRKGLVPCYDLDSVRVTHDSLVSTTGEILYSEKGDFSHLFQEEIDKKEGFLTCPKGGGGKLKKTQAKEGPKRLTGAVVEYAGIHLRFPLEKRFPPIKSIEKILSDAPPREKRRAIRPEFWKKTKEWKKCFPLAAEKDTWGVELWGQENGLLGVSPGVLEKVCFLGYGPSMPFSNNRNERAHAALFSYENFSRCAGMVASPASFVLEEWEENQEHKSRIWFWGPGYTLLVLGRAYVKKEYAVNYRVSGSEIGES